MGVINDYMSGSSDDTPALKSVGNVINQYMITSDEPKRKTSAPTGYNAVTGTTEYQTPEDVSKATVTGSHSGKGISDVALEAGGAVGSAAKAGALEASQGLGEALSGKPASGIGKIGTGLLSIVGSPSEAVSSVVSDITGNRNIGEKAGLVAGLALPVVPGVKAVNAARPTNKALKDLTEMVGPENAGKVAAEMRADPRL